jgi:polyhydroxyalkanoate synthesis regulator phasin
MWAVIAKWATKIALYAVGHQQVIDQIVKDAKVVIEEGKVIVKDVKGN